MGQAMFSPPHPAHILANISGGSFIPRTDTFIQSLGSYVCVCMLSHVQLFVTPWTVALQSFLSMGFPRQEYWSGLPFPLPGDLSDLGIKPVSPALADGFFTTEPPRKP